MTRGEFLLKISEEGRAWAEFLHLPALFAFIAWHLPQPKWVARFLKKKNDGRS